MSRSKKPVNPNAQKALDRLKEETANEIGLSNYKNQNKATLTSADNGRVGGQMVRKMVQSQQNQYQAQGQGAQNQGQGMNAGKNQTLTAKYDVNKKS